MPRDTSLLYPAKPLAPLLQAATILLLRDSAQGLQVLMTRRSKNASFAPGAYVFPGGGIEVEDEAFASPLPAESNDDALSRTPFVTKRPSQSSQIVCWSLAAIRESFEELGIVLARRADGGWVTQADIQRLNRERNFYGQMQAQGWQLAADEVFLFAHWMSDRDLPKRFDVPFLVARVPPDQSPVADENEQFAPEWVYPKDALTRHATKQFFMIFPTIRTLERLGAFSSVDDVLRACSGERALWTSCPRAGLMHGQQVRFMEDDSAYGELALVAPYGQSVHELNWQHDRPVALLKHVQRLTAPNPGSMTGPGTNTYIIGTAATGYLVVDPGPREPAHIDRIIAATGGDIVAIVCTHSHPDHSPAAQPLQALVVEASNTIPLALTAQFARHICPILGLQSGATARDTAAFAPDIKLQHNELLSGYFRGSSTQSSGDEPKLLVVHTPGHAANHLCLLMPEDGLIFTGDHILNGSTTVIDPPDGNMTDYLNSLDLLYELCRQNDIRFILPAHGYVLSHCEATQGTETQRGDARSDSEGGAIRAIAALKTHRLKREAKISGALNDNPQASLDELVSVVYSDVDVKMWPMAKRSLAAHLERLRPS